MVANIVIGHAREEEIDLIFHIDPPKYKLSRLIIMQVYILFFPFDAVYLSLFSTSLT